MPTPRKKKGPQELPIPEPQELPIPEGFIALDKLVPAVFNGGNPKLTGEKACVVAVRDYHGHLMPKDIMVGYVLKDGNKVETARANSFSNSIELYKELQKQV